MCSHCPHYAEDGSYLKCWANYGVPKLWKFNPGPMSRLEDVLFLGGLAVVWGLPLITLIATFQIFFFITFILATAGFFMTLKACFCSICFNFACPLNEVNEENREKFFKNNSETAKAWGKLVEIKEEPKKEKPAQKTVKTEIKKVAKKAEK